jgi:hypothetical protein
MLYVKSVEPMNVERQRASFIHELLLLSEKAVWGEEFQGQHAG